MRIKIWTALGVVYLVWGATYLAIFYAVESLPPFILGGIRFAVAGVLIYAWRRTAGDPTPTRAEWKSAVIAGLFLLVCGNGGVTWAEQYVASSIAALVIASVPLWMVMIDRFLFGREFVPRRSMAGIVIGFVGILLLIGRPEFSGSNLDLNFVGILVLLFAAFTWALGSVYIRYAVLPSSQLMSTSMFMLAGSVGLFILGAISGEWNQLDVPSITYRSWTALAYLIFFGSMIGFVTYGWLLRNAPISLVATYAYVNPIVAVILGVLIAGEPFSVRLIISTAVIIFAVVLANTNKLELRKPTMDSSAAAVGND